MAYLSTYAEQQNINQSDMIAKSFVGPQMPQDKAVELHRTIQKLVADGNLEKADEILDNELELEPKNERALGLASLVAMASQNWLKAIDLLENLAELQAEHTPVQVFIMLLRSYRCIGKHLDAMKTAQRALVRHANDPELVEEAASVAEYLDEWESAILALEVLVEMHEMQKLDVPEELIKRLDTATLMTLALGQTKTITL